MLVVACNGARATKISPVIVLNGTCNSLADRACECDDGRRGLVECDVHGNPGECKCDDGGGGGQEGVTGPTMLGPQPPEAPANLTVNPGNGIVIVTWTAPASSEPITSYTVTSDPEGITVTVEGTATMAVVTGLTNGAIYTFTVHATSTIGDGPESTPSEANTPRATPFASANVVVTPHPTIPLQVNVTWDAPNNGGTPIQRYLLEATPGGATRYTVDASTSFDFVGLPRGTYTFTVRAENAAGLGVASAPSAATLLHDVPDPPSSVTATPHASTPLVAVVTWPAAQTYGEPITRYTVTRTPGAVSVSTVNGSTLSATFTGLTRGTSYTFRVVSESAMGNSAPSVASSPMAAVDVPNAPTSVTAAGATRSPSLR